MFEDKQVDNRRAHVPRKYTKTSFPHAVFQGHLVHVVRKVAVLNAIQRISGCFRTPTFLYAPLSVRSLQVYSVN
jgi:hypothetical protein